MKGICIFLVVLLAVQAQNSETEVAVTSAFSNLKVFAEGFLGGFVSSNTSYSVLSYRELESQWGAVVEAATGLVYSGNINFLWVAISNLDIWADGLDGTLSDCNLSLLIARVTEIVTLQELSSIVARISLNTNKLISDWSTLFTNLAEPAVAGKALGEIFSTILGYTI